MCKYVVYHIYQMQKEDNGLHMGYVLLYHQNLLSDVTHIPF
jgi:hypothetical protein